MTKFNEDSVETYRQVTERTYTEIRSLVIQYNSDNSDGEDSEEVMLVPPAWEDLTDYQKGVWAVSVGPALSSMMQVADELAGFIITQSN